MNISTNCADELLDTEKPEHGYEWWYFDAISVDKNWSIVLIFYQGNPFSPKYLSGTYGFEPQDYPALSISMYYKGKCEFYSFQEYHKEQCIWDTEPLNISVGSSSFNRLERDTEIEYELLLNQSLASGHSITGKLKFISPKTNPELISKKDEGGKHKWNLLQPRAKVVGSVKVEGKSDKFHVGFHGNGYHDHNTGWERMSDSFDDWYWGRFHFKEYTLIYYLMNKKNEQQYDAWLIDAQNQQIVAKFDRVSLSEPKKNLLGLSSSRQITLTGVVGNVVVNQKKCTDDGPFYQRFISEANLTTKSGVEQSKGISEYIHPARIELQKYWWMVHMRLRYMSEKPHWVQKSKFFYEWTW